MENFTGICAGAGHRGSRQRHLFAAVPGLRRRRQPSDPSALADGGEGAFAGRGRGGPGEPAEGGRGGPGAGGSGGDDGLFPPGPGADGGPLAAGPGGEARRGQCGGRPPENLQRHRLFQCGRCCFRRGGDRAGYRRRPGRRHGPGGAVYHRQPGLPPGLQGRQRRRGGPGAEKHRRLYLLRRQQQPLAGPCQALRPGVCLRPGEGDCGAGL